MDNPSVISKSPENFHGRRGPGPDNPPRSDSPEHDRFTGIVYLVGAGPGDPDLITVKGLNALRKADVVVYDRLTAPELLNHVPDHTELIYVGKKPGKASASQEQINRILLEKARENKRVVRLKGGDPFIFGRGGEEARYLKSHGIRFEPVPGISSALAGPAYAGIPLTYRNSGRSFSVITGHTSKPGEPEHDWKRLAEEETLVVLMGMGNLPQITQQLMQNGKSPDTPAAVIHKATHRSQVTIIDTLNGISEKAGHLGAPSVIVIGEVVRMSADMEWVVEANADAGNHFSPDPDAEISRTAFGKAANS